MKELIKKILNEQLGSQTGAKVCAVICDPKPNQTPVGEHCDGWFIKICHTWNTGCQTPEVGDYMVSHSNMGMTSWKITRIEEYGTVTDYRMRYPTCEYVSEGCTDPQACNFSQGYTQSCSNCCIYEGCNDPNADNYSPGLWCGGGCCCDDTTGNGYPDCCTYTILGCTNPGAVNYNPQANTDDGSCQYPTTYECSDGQCVLDVNGQYNDLESCQQNCFDCAHSECYHCPGPSNQPSTNNCIAIGQQWSQALSNGISLYTNVGDCETAESNCGGTTQIADTEECHCCKKNADGTSTLTVMPGLVSVGNCNSFEDSGGAGAKKYTSSSPDVEQGTQHFSGVYHSCAPVTQMIDCGGGTEEEANVDIREDIQRIKKLIKY